MSAALDQPWLDHDAWLEIDLAALASNGRVLRQATPRSAELGILVKAEAYGHGLVMAARTAASAGADRLIVATLSEGIAIREAGLTLPVLVVYPVPAPAIATAARADLSVAVSGSESARALADAWRRDRPATGGRVRVHVEIDTGMGRGGTSSDGLVDVLTTLRAVPGIEVTGVWSHLADGTDPEVSAVQVARLQAALSLASASGLADITRHLVASDGFFAETAPVLDLARIGLAFYGELGLHPRIAAGRAEAAAALQPAITVKAHPVRIELVATGSTVGYGGEWRAERPSFIATIPLGYADGWKRSLWPGAEVLVRGQRAPLVGRVSMDSICVDVTDVGPMALDTEVVLLGAQGSDRITVNELAARAGTIPNDILASLGQRPPRVYVDDGRVVASSRGITHLATPDRETRPDEPLSAGRHS